jgi:DNA-binding transcriptional regulator YdaS (Cro superfamily)
MRGAVDVGRSEIRRADPAIRSSSVPEAYYGSVSAADLRPPRAVPPIGLVSWVSRLMLVSRPAGGDPRAERAGWPAMGGWGRRCAAGGGC